MDRHFIEACPYPCEVLLPQTNRIETLCIDWQTPTSHPFIFKGHFHDDSGLHTPLLAHVYYSFNENEAYYWCDVALSMKNSDKLLRVHACTRQNAPDGSILIIVLTEPSDSSLKDWLNSNERILTRTSTQQLTSFSCKLKRVLRGALTCLVNLWGKNIRHGNVSSESIFILGEPGSETGKLGRFKGENHLDPAIGPMDQERINHDIYAFCRMICDICSAQSNVNYPSDLQYFLNCFNDPKPQQAPSRSNPRPLKTVVNSEPLKTDLHIEWKQFNILNSPNHPLFLEDKQKAEYWPDAHRKTEALKKHYPPLYVHFRDCMETKLLSYGIRGTDWIKNVENSGHRESVRCLYYNPGQGMSSSSSIQKPKILYELINPTSFFDFALNFCVHYQTLTDQQKARYLDSYYPGYLCVLHEVLSGIKVFVLPNPNGVCSIV